MSHGSLLITGATGFLGRHILAVLAERSPPRPVLVLVRNLSSWNTLDYASTHPWVTPLEGGLGEALAWQDDPRVKDVRAILHLAAVVHHSRREPPGLTDTNVEGTLRLIRFAGRERIPVIFVSTSGTVACHERPGRVEDETAPFAEAAVARWPYYASKIRAEREGRALADELGVPFCVFRPPVLLGPGDHRFRSTGLVIRFLRGRIPFMIDGGISICDIRDAARAILVAVGHPERKPVYHLPGHDFTVSEFFGLCGEVSGVPVPRRFVPYRIAHSLATVLDRCATFVGRHSPLPDPVVIEMGRCHWGVSSRHAECDLGYRTRDARVTLAETISWLKDHHPILRALR